MKQALGIAFKATNLERKQLGKIHFFERTIEKVRS